MSVQAWTEKVTIPTYEVGEPDKNPMFFEKRVYQGSSGVVYPNPIIEKIYDEKIDKEYEAVFLENKYIKIMILPELGGRIQMAYDKIKDRHFIYYNQVIKPALVGLCGPWISGGIEFNWPQHHRPSTFERVEYTIADNADGSKTVWVNEIEKMFHTKGMAGFTLHPDTAYIEIKAKLSNLTGSPQTFLWWANPAVKVHDDYQSVFPPDVNAVFDHGKRDVSSFPIATGTYYKVDYSPGTDISRYKNIPVPTSYMAINSKYDFVGGYEHDIEAGMLHIADHHVSPGKKQWTWGNGDFGVAWDRNLTDEDGPYIELMAGVFTDNQPDFSWLKPFEEKTFTQYFLPYRELGVLKNASKDILLSFDLVGEKLVVKVFATTAQQILVDVRKKDSSFFSETISIHPEEVFVKEFAISSVDKLTDFSIRLLDASQHILLVYNPNDDVVQPPLPEAAKPALLPDEIEHIEQLFLTGHHLEQYRHATYRPLPYYLEGIKRDKGDVRCNNAVGAWHLKRGMFEKSIPYFEQAVATIISRNPNPYNCEPYYNLGLAFLYLNKLDEAYDAFFKSTWDNAYQDAAYFYIAQIDLVRGKTSLALEHVDWAIDRNARNGKAYLIKIVALNKLGRTDEALKTVGDALKRDQFNLSVQFEKYQAILLETEHEPALFVKKELIKLSGKTEHNAVEYAIDYIQIGAYQRALDFIMLISGNAGRSPLTEFYLAYIYAKMGDENSSATHLVAGAEANSNYCFPNRQFDILVLNFVITSNPTDAKAPYYLGNLYYDKQQYDEAISLWEQSAHIDATFPTVLRNLGIAYYNKLNDKEKALEVYEKAFALDTNDDRVLMELDSLYKKLNKPAEWRLEFLTKFSNTAIKRDDLYLEMIALENFLGNAKQAYASLMERKFHPWEGGEGKVSEQYKTSLIELAKKDFINENYNDAIANLKQAPHYPENLGEGKLVNVPENDIFYWIGCCENALNETDLAKASWQIASKGSSEPGMAMFYNDQQPDKIFYQGCAWRKLGDTNKANEIFNRLVNFGEEHLNDKIVLDYFAVSLPDLLIFDSDLNQNNNIHCLYISALGYLGLSNLNKATELFNQVLAKDATHLGAKIHLDLIDSELVKLL